MKTIYALLAFLILLNGVIYSATPKKYAVIITPTRVSDNSQNSQTIYFDEDEAFWNDTYLMWEMLVTQKGFDNNNVFVLFDNGTDKNQLLNMDWIDQRYTVANSGLQLAHITDFPADSVSVTKVLTGLRFGTYGMPKINEDDFLFVFTFGHGAIYNLGLQNQMGALVLQDNDMMDYEFAALINKIPANKRVIWMQNCVGGDFVDDLDTTNNYYMSPTRPWPNGVLARSCDDAFFDPNGVYHILPNLENELISSIVYPHGEFIFHLYSNANGKAPDFKTYYVQAGIGDYTNNDYNADNFKTMHELFLYEDLVNSITAENPNYKDTTNIGDYTSFEYPTLLHDNLTQSSMSCRGLIGISNNTVVKAGTTLTLKANSKVHLLNGGNLIVEAGANLVIESGVLFKKDFSGSSKIQISGTISSCNNVEFDGGSGSAMQFITNNISGIVNINNCTFKNCAYKGTSGQIIVENSNFTKSYCEIGSPLSSINLAFIRYNEFQGDGITTYPAISIDGVKQWVIIDNTINQYPDGAKVWNSGKITTPYLFSVNTITNCSGTGAIFYNSRATVYNNKITGNNIGIESRNNSTLYVYGLCSATSVSQTQQISYNLTTQVVSNGNFPITFIHNAIEANNTNTARILCNYSPPNSIYNIEKNYWGANISPQTYPDILSFYPLPTTSSYDWNPIWPLGYDCTGGGGGESDMLKAADSTYQIGISYTEAENFELAKNTFSSVIEEYPATAYAQSALSELYYLEGSTGENYNNLIEFYETNTTIANDTSLQKAASFNANLCNIELGNYGQAIEWFENVIENPDNFNDSIYAIIDLGYTYLLAGEDSTKSCPVGRYQEYKPRTQPEFVEYRDYLLSLVNPENPESLNDGSKFKPAIIKSVNPNPASESINIQFDILAEGEISFNVRNTLGQSVLAIPAEHLNKGTRFSKININSIPFGTYILTISVNGILSDSYKLIKY